jgi:hypothetical protein
MAHEIPDFQAVLEDHLRPLLAVTAFAAHALQVALEAEYPDAILDEPSLDDWPQDPARWTAEVLSAHLETVRVAIGLYETALRHRHAPQALRSTRPPEPPF